jgi:diacylglycerol kinase family enzyme
MTSDAAAEPTLVGPGRRVLAIVALVALLSALACLVWIGIESAPGLLVAVAALLAAAVASGSAIVHRGWRRRLTQLIAVAALACSVTIAIASGAPRPAHVGRLALLAAAIVVYVVTSRAALRRTVRARDVWRRQRRPRRPVLVINPLSGGGRFADRIVAAARRAGAEVVELAPDDDVQRVVHELVDRGVDCVATAGGDGTLSAVASVLTERNCPMLVVPAGTRNHLALDLGLDRRRPWRALKALRSGYRQRIDLGSVNGRVFVNNVSLGAYASVVADARYRDAKVATASDVIPDVMAAEGARPALRFVDDAGEQAGDVDVVLVSNNPYEFHSVRAFGRRPRLDAGQLGIATLRLDSGPSTAVAVVLAMTGNPDLHPGFHEWSAERLDIRADGPLAAAIDGEPVELTSPVTFASHPSALDVLLPPGATIRARGRGGSLRDLARLAALGQDRRSLPVAGDVRRAPGIGTRV